MKLSYVFTGLELADPAVTPAELWKAVVLRQAVPEPRGLNP